MNGEKIHDILINSQYQISADMKQEITKKQIETDFDTKVAASMMEPGSLILITNRESEDVEEKLPEKATERKRIDESF